MSKFQKLQLDDINYEYEKFRENQLLTHQQLNRFIEFFEDQDRITRTCLIGVGLVCGLTAKWSKGVLYVNKGCAVTTDGDLMVIEQNIGFKYFKKYDNRRKGTDEPIYDPFFPPASKGSQITLWEMRTTKDDDTGVPAIEINKFSEATGLQITDMVALLYLENYLSEPDDCTAIDCNHLGQLQNNKIKVLLVHPNDADAIINKETSKEVIVDDIYKSYYDAYTSYFELPELKSKRVILNKNNTTDLKILNQDYLSIVNGGINELADAISKLYHTFKFILDETTYFKIGAIQNTIKSYSGKNLEPYQVQYLYDFYKDLLDCYNELRDTIYNAVYICCPNKYAFPKHIMLGIVNGALGPRPPKYRHYFYPSPVTSRGKSYLSVARFMFNRLTNMINGFAIPQRIVPIRITPSFTPDKTLEWRAIPFYYNNANILLDNWSYYRTMRGTNTNILSYHFADNIKGSFVSNPLDYDIDKNNFFRIEGHQGWKLDDALRHIIDVKNEKNLPFDIIAVRLSNNLTADINFEDYSVYFEDLNVVLNAWIVSQKCLFAKAIKFFSAFNVSGKNQSVKTGPEANYRESASIAKQSLNNDIYTNETKESFNNYQYQSNNFSYNNYKYFSYNKNESFLKDNLVRDEGTLGSMLYEIDYGKIPRPSDYVIIEIRKKIKDNEFIRQLPEELVEIAFYIPALLIARLTDVLNYEPFGLDDLTGDTLQNYEQALAQLCTDVNESINKATAYFTKIQNDTNVNTSSNEIAMQYLNTLQALKDNCCAADSIEILVTEIENRKQKIADLLTFTNYAEKHKGLEHRAGVERGGTFVLLYASADDANVDFQIGTTNDKILDLIYRYEREYLFKGKKNIDLKEFYKQDEAYYLVALAYNAKRYNVVTEIENYVKSTNPSANNNKQLQLKTKQLVDKINLIAGRIATQPKRNTVNNIVVADFCLPYLCKSDIPPMTFVVPPIPEVPEQPEYSLSLPVKEVCANDENIYEFTKSPTDGVVNANLKEASLAIFDKDNKTFFSPSKVDASIHGKTITFTINDQVTNCTLVVQPLPNADFTYEYIISNNALELQLFINSENFKTDKYYWEIYNGNEVRNENVIDYQTNVIFKLAELNEPFLKVRLYASKDICTNYSEKVIDWKGEEVNVSLDLGKSVVCIDEKPFKIKDIQPDNALLHCENAPDIVNGYTINPSLVKNEQLGKSLNFTVNGKSVTATLFIFAPADPTFSIDEKSVKRLDNYLYLNLILKNPGKNNYNVSINNVQYGDVYPDDKGVIKIERFDVANMDTGFSILLSAKADKNNPCSDQTFEQKISVPKNQEPPKKEQPKDDTPKVETTCLNAVKSSIIISDKSLKNILNTTKDRNLLEIGQLLIGYYGNVSDDIAKNGSVTVIDSVLNALQTLHAKLMDYKLNTLSATFKSDAIVLMQLRKYVIELALNVVRCDAKFSKAREEKLAGIIKSHNEVLPNAIKLYGSNNELMNDYKILINDFIETFASKNTNIIDLLSQTLKIVK